MHTFLHLGCSQSAARGQSGPTSALTGMLKQARAAGVLNALGAHRPARSDQACL